MTTQFYLRQFIAGLVSTFILCWGYAGVRANLVEQRQMAQIPETQATNADNLVLSGNKKAESGDYQGAIEVDDQKSRYFSSILIFNDQLYL